MVKKTVKKRSAKKALPKGVTKTMSKDAPAKKPAPRKKTPSKDTHELHAFIMKALEQEKGEDVVSIDLQGKSAIADFMVIVSGTSARHVVAMAKKLRDKVTDAGWRARVEGADGGDWVILDARDVIVHFFRPEVRAFYNLEKLWGTDFSTVDYTLYKSV